MRSRMLSLLTLAAAAALAVPGLGAGEKFKSGLEPGRYIGGPFEPYNVNGKQGAGRFHCLVCEFRLDPAVAIFVREGQGANEAPVQELLKKVDDAVGRHEEAYLKSFAVFLHPDARSSVTEKKVEDTDLLVEEALKRDKLVKRLEELAKPLKHVVVGVYPGESLKGYDIAKEPGVTVMLYVKHKVKATYAFPEGKLMPADIDQVLKGVDELVRKEKKKAAPAK